MAKSKFDLSAIIAATSGSNAGALVHTSAKQFSNPKAYEKAIEDGLIEVNPSMTNANGEVATRATEKGIASMTESTTATPAAEKSAAPAFEIQDGATLTPIDRGTGLTGGTERYPFSKLGVGQSFFVAATAENADPAKSMASTVSSASKRYATETGETKQRGDKTVPVLAYERKFELRRRTAEQEQADGFKPQAGVRIYRTK
ncbi:Phage protein [Xanthomonas phage Suba]|uniref:Phage protein n=1 Tax=Xanthomonas phage Suba TaxID=2674975 RepID=A0A679K429_9CAUD|nr:Phage protein [Xanthomonas phage Suba]CAA2409893.1 Phage protein [Xanthomonas phage Suba]